MKCQVSILQGFLPHYRADFFSGLGKHVDLSVYCYEPEKNTSNLAGVDHDLSVKNLSSIKIGPFVVYNLFALLRSNAEIIVLMLNFTHISTWVLLLTKPFHKKKIILFGHGISVKRFIKEEKKPSILLRWMIYLSDGIWFYTSHELNLWKRVYPKLKGVSLNNTISEVDTIFQKVVLNKEEVKAKYKIRQKRILIFCARFNTPARRIDLLIKIIQSLDTEKFGFIIIGDGKLKPDFSSYSNVYDFGEVYDRGLKNELFQVADIYFQPGWVGLSIVEGMAYGLPVFTFERSETLLQCVEYSYLTDSHNAMLARDVDDFIKKVNSLSDDVIKDMGSNARKFTEKNLSMDRMITNAYNFILEIANKQKVNR